jgi:DNA polymerase III sliding clamp (beta) subunit (PCNA family)
MSTKTIDRETLIQQLESVQPGLSQSARESVEQSSCYVFKGGKVMTFNDEIACTQECDIGGAEGAVASKVLLEILHKLGEDELEVSTTDAELLFKGKNGRKIAITREADCLLPIDDVEQPTKFVALPEEFLDAIKMARDCTSADDSQFQLTCISITPDYIEACDNTQYIRITVDTKVKSPIMVRRDSIKYIVDLGMSKFCETETWIHFKNPKGLMLSCRRFVDEYPDFSKLLKVKGTAITLPKGLGAAADKAAVFATDTTEDPKVLIELRQGKLRIKGKGNSGWYSEIKQVNYEGDPLSFRIAPGLLIDITKKYNAAEITVGRLKVDGGKWTYVSCLVPVEG